MHVTSSFGYGYDNYIGNFVSCTNVTFDSLPSDIIAINNSIVYINIQTAI